MERLQQLKEEVRGETTYETLVRNFLNEVATGENCICKKCDEAVKCEHEGPMHELSKCGACSH